MFPTRPITLDRFEGAIAVLKADDGQELRWPRTELPEGAAIGAVFSLGLLTNKELTDERARFAKTLLNEILAPDHDNAAR
ncbi:DUF3006 domain-containing protein [Candidatus Uhrbacteria bacterium]|nr:DUF3006 domain-containing protein [Candidatus Uhrbacteria bacterium]